MFSGRHKSERNTDEQILAWPTRREDYRRSPRFEFLHDAWSFHLPKILLWRGMSLSGLVLPCGGSLFGLVGTNIVDAAHYDMYHW